MTLEIAEMGPDSSNLDLLMVLNGGEHSWLGLLMAVLCNFIRSVFSLLTPPTAHQRQGDVKLFEMLTCVIMSGNCSIALEL